jgi:sugar/nucleoside kinase (ribokinase family)
MRDPDTAPRIHVAGNSVLDLLLRDVSLDDAQGVEAWKEGSVNFLQHPVTAALGGNGAGTAYVLGRLEETVSLNTQVGTDPLGSIVRSWLRQARVTLVAPPAKTTAVNVVLLSPRGKPQWHYYTGQKVVWGRSLAVKKADWFFASGYGQVQSQDLEELLDVFRAFRTRGAKVAFDPGPWILANVPREQVSCALGQVDCLIGTEAELSTGHWSRSIQVLVEELLELGPKLVAVKRGAEGAACGERSKGVEVLRTEVVSCANAVGAGDTFNAGLLHGLCRGKELASAVRIGLDLSTQVVKRGRGVLGAVSNQTPGTSQN